MLKSAIKCKMCYEMLKMLLKSAKKFQNAETLKWKILLLDAKLLKVFEKLLPAFVSNGFQTVLEEINVKNSLSQKRGAFQAYSA